MSRCRWRRSTTNSCCASIVGRVEEITERRDGEFEVRIALAGETVGDDPGQLLNMLFGNTSLHEDVVLEDVAFPGELAFSFGGPRHGLAGCGGGSPPARGR